MRTLSCFAPAIRLSVLLVLSLALTGCIRDRVHQPVTVVAPTPTWTSQKAFYKSDESKHPIGDTDHATVEFLENGGLADPCDTKTHPTGKPPCQLHFAEAFIRQARRLAQGEGEKLVVITFIHGNENYAGENADNYPHFRQLIACLNLGQKDYSQQYREWVEPNGQTHQSVINCSGFNANTKVRFVGIFIGWRGLTTLLHANVRERAALGISKHPYFVQALYQLRDAAKIGSDPVTHQPFSDVARFVVFGHSFGGLLLEQSAIRIYSDAYTHAEGNIGPCENAPHPSTGILPFTDMMVTINPAVHAVQAKKLIELFQMHPDTMCGDEVIASSLSRPLLVTFVSKSDFWSEPVGSWFRHTLGGEHEHPDTFRFTEDVQGSAPPLGLVYTKTPGWLPYFQNLCYFDSKEIDKKDTYCNYEKKELSSSELTNALAVNSDPEHVPAERKSISPGDVPPNMQNAPGYNPGDDPLEHIYVRYNCRPSDVPPAADGRSPCGTPTPYFDRSVLGVWNRTPYWISAINIDVIKGHNDLWNARFIALLEGLASAFDVLNEDQVLPNPYPRL
ncbi:hypothetical protein [Tunturiibacter gelidoferens]|uniref:Uncharacterized protein n=1 Tax=Tunturiibacter gelidiferens TaxID=3069689 RepID=A0ACC5P422_9BACT|nr:hypothetical protein [Edaphobacter lichenicola]MBB5341471.1 hypothetical protein [Edaphobacter lichenicola]